MRSRNSSKIIKQKSKETKTRPLKKIEATEKQIEKSILEYLNRIPNCVAWKINTTGIYDPIKGLFRKNRNKFVINGITDINGIFNGRPLYIEVKRPSTRRNTTVYQNDFLEMVRKHGAIAFVACSLEEVKEALIGKDI